MIFTIKKGSHTGFKFPHLTFKKKLSIKITLIGNFEYKCDIPENQKDTNKIIGLSDDFFHRINSVRLGYRYLNSKIELMLYYYNDRKHYSIKIGEVITNKEFEVEIEIVENEYLITFNKEKFVAPRTSNWKFIRYILFPYFGGQEKAKENLTFNIKID